MTLSTRTRLKRPRRTLNRLAWGLLAIGMGGLAQSLFRQGGIWDGIFLFAPAAFLFGRALAGVETGGVSRWPPYRGLFAGLALRLGLWGRAGSGLLFLALFLSFIGRRLFGDNDTLGQAWLFYAGSLLTFFSGGLLLTVGSRPAKPDFKQGGIARHFRFFRFSITPDALILLAILFLALILRLWQLNQIPFGVWFDEAEAGLQARRWLVEPKFKPPFYDPINVSGQFLLIYAAALRFISDSVLGMRMVSVLFGVGGVWTAYLFGRAIRGPHFGLLMAFFMAVMRWDINFSRIAMTGIDAPFFELLTLFFLARLVKGGRLRDAILSGLTLGLGLSFYTAFRLFVLALGVFTLIGAVIWRGWWGRRSSWRWWSNQLIRLGLLALATWIALMPVAQYAQRNPDSFSNRLQVTSIFNRRDDPNLGRALGRSWGQHAAMFHLKGDRNGRHNLPGEPMLDPVMGILLVLGMAVALRNLFSQGAKPANLFFTLLVPISLAGGVFSLDFEAPQSLRSIAVLPAIAYFCALSVANLTAEAERAIRPFSPRLLLWPAGLVAFYILGFNAHTYFVRQANDFSSWNEFSTPETLAGRRMAQLGPGYDFYLSPFLTNHPTVRFVAPDVTRRITLSFPDPLPIRSDASRPVALFIHPDERWVFDEAARLYPSGNFEALSNDPRSPPSVYVVELTAGDLASVQGLELRYWAGVEKESDQVPVKALRVDTIDADWTTSLPLTPPYFAEWVGVLYVEQYGRYQLHLKAPAEAILEIDGLEVIRGEGELQVPWELARGNHTLRLTAHSGAGVVQLGWQPPAGSETIIPAQAFYSHPVANNGLLGKYYANPEWQGSPVFMQIDPFLDTYFHLTPLPRPYSVVWSGMLEIPAAGVYGLGLRAVGEAQLFVDGNLLTRTVAEEPTRALPSPITQAPRNPLLTLLGVIAVLGGGLYIILKLALSSSRLESDTKAKGGARAQFVPLKRPSATSLKYAAIGSLILVLLISAPVVWYREYSRESTSAPLVSDPRQKIAPVQIFPDRPFEANASLTAGLHEISVLFKDTEPRSRLHLLWRSPGSPDLVPIPSRHLWPSLGSVRQPDIQIAAAAPAFDAQPLTLRHVATLAEGLVQPRDVTVGPGGTIYVADAGDKKVQLFAGEALLDSWDETPDGPFEEPLAMVAATDGTIWVLDSTRQWVYGFDETGSPVGKIGGPEAQFYHPRGLGLFSQAGGDDTLVVTNTGSGNLRLFSLDGVALGSVGLFGDAPGQFNEPVDALRDTFGTYFVTEGANINRWQRVDPFGKPLADWPLDAPVAFDGSHLAWGPEGSILMTNSDKGLLRRYSPEGELLAEWRTIDGVTFSQPVGIFVDAAQNRLFVSDVGTGQVHIFQVELPAFSE